MDTCNRATLPTITESRVQKKILSLIRNTRDFSRTLGERKTRDSYTSKVCEYDLTFDIFLCPCVKQVNSYSDINITRELCQCSQKIPLIMIDLKFLFDQIGKRLKYIGPVNVPESRLNNSRMNRKEHEKDRSNRKYEINETFRHSEFSERQTEGNVDFENNIPESLINVGNELYHIYERTSDNNTNRYPNLAKTAFRYRVYDRAVAAICSSIIENLKLLDEFVKT